MRSHQRRNWSAYVLYVLDVFEGALSLIHAMMLLSRR